MDVIACHWFQPFFLNDVPGLLRCSMDTNYHPKNHSIHVRNGSGRPSSGPQTLLPVNSQGDISIRECKQQYLLETHLELVKDLQLNLGDVQIPQSAEYRNNQPNALWQQQ